MANILLVDDDYSMRAFLDKALSKEGYDVDAFSSGEEALSFFNKSPFNFDLVLTDIVMPGLDGISLAREIKAQLPKIPIIYMTGFSVSEEDLEKDQTVLIQKPFHVRDIVKLVAAAIIKSGKALPRSTISLDDDA